MKSSRYGQKEVTFLLIEHNEHILFITEVYPL